MKPDPPVRPDGLCRVCRRPRHPERSRRYGKGAADLDPFCSTECARAFHGQPNLNEQGHERRQQANRRHAQSQQVRANPVKHGTREGYYMCACDQCVSAVKECA